MTPLQRSALLVALRGGMGLGEACRQVGVGVARVRREMAAEGAGGEGLAREVAAACAEGEKAALGPAWAGVVAASAEAQRGGAAVGTGMGYPAPGGPSRRASEATDDGAGGIDLEGWVARWGGEGRAGLYRAQDERLVAGGYPETSAWWRWTFESYFESERTWLLALVGRGAGKSTFLERLLLVAILFTERVIPPGQTYQSPFISVLPEDARRRIYEIQRLLLIAYRMELKVNNGGITVKDISGNDIELVSVAGTVGRVSGPSTVSVIFDEAAKLHTAPGAANLDSELIASVVGTSRLLPGWMGVRCSSAWETRGAHFLSCVEGTNAQNYVATIGPQFIDAALSGLEEVARFESSQGNSHEAAQIRAYAKTIGPQSPNVPTWVARPEQSALRLRMMLDTLPKDDPALEGLTRHQYWLREYASMPLSREGGADHSAACFMAADMTQKLGERFRGLAPREPGAARVGGGIGAQAAGLWGGGWKTRRGM